MNQFTKIIAAQLKLREQAVENTLELLEEGCTIPFISRYRKEETGNRMRLTSRPSLRQTRS